MCHQVFKPIPSRFPEHLNENSHLFKAINDFEYDLCHILRGSQLGGKLQSSRNKTLTTTTRVP